MIIIILEVVVHLIFLVIIVKNNNENGYYVCGNVPVFGLEGGIIAGEALLNDTGKSLLHSLKGEEVVVVKYVIGDVSGTLDNAVVTLALVFGNVKAIVHSGRTELADGGVLDQTVYNVVNVDIVAVKNAGSYRYLGRIKGKTGNSLYKLRVNALASSNSLDNAIESGLVRGTCLKLMIFQLIHHQHQI